MTLRNEIINSFSAGELSPKLYGRTDLPIHQHAVKTLKNAATLPQGGAQRRNGTKFCRETKNMAAKGRLIPFEQSTTTAYIIELGNLFARFYKDQAPVLEATKVISAATKANPCVVTATSHGYSNGDHVEIASVVGMTELNGFRFTVANKTTNTFQLSGINSSAYTTYTSAGTSARVYTLTTVFTTAQLFDIQFTQDGPTMYLQHNGHITQQLTRTADTSWTIAGAAFVDGPYEGLNKSAITMTPNATSGSGITITASSASFATTDTTGSGGNGAYDRHIRILHSTTWGYAKIVGFTSTTVVTADVVTAFGGTGASADWRLGAFSTTSGFATAIGLFEQRLCLMGTTSLPQNFWASLAGFPLQFVPGTDDDDPIDFTLADYGLNAARWIASVQQNLFSGTTKGEWNHAGDMKPSSPNIRNMTHEGSALVQPVAASNALLFLQKSGLRIYELAQTSDASGAFTVNEVSWHAEHITVGGITQMAYQNDPTRTCWMIRADGSLIGFTYEKAHNVQAFHEHTTGASGSFESVAIIPKSSGDCTTQDEVWVIVQRTVNSGTKRYVEFMCEDLNTDCAIEYDDSEITSLTGLDHLEGESLVVKADGAVIPNKTVSSGAIALGASYSTVEAGLSYEHHIESLEIAPILSRGSSMGQLRRTYQVILRVRNSLGSTVQDEDIIYRDSEDPMDAAPPAFTGDIVLNPNTAWSRGGTINIKGSQPYDFALTALVLSTGIHEA